ncbi:fatty acid desaturase [Motilibacter peucedani]|uniref:Fatty acid desaturase n=1 Tax=Motilibacter peucedani TaxID=598650 RepID=A0A420XKU9_9ACTN|nr:acyl-CoA desaturase [Motilibacter peucedani]RKS69160.1 fatty acid desaturase [Motilibacter peucedani]
MTSGVFDPSAPAGERPARPLRNRERHVTDYAELSKQVMAAGLLQRRLGWYWTYGLLLLGAFVALWVGVVLLGDSWLQLGLAALMAVVLSQLTFLGHDTAHRQVFASHAWNEWTSRLIGGVVTGLSYAWWSSKHNRHHSGPNQLGRDPDIESAVLAFSDEAAEGRTGLAAWWTRHQGWAFFPLLLLEGVNLHAAGVRTLLTRREARHRRLELTLVLSRLTAYVVVLAVVLPPLKAVAFAAVQLGLFGVLMGASFAPNHKGMPIVPRSMNVDFLRRQVLMSRNVRGGLLTDFAMGGLNYQVEHHLFPSMPRPNLRRAQPLVRRFCEERGVAYTEAGMLESYGIVVRYLNSVGLGARDPFTCPLASSLRG